MSDSASSSYSGSSETADGCGDQRKLKLTPYFQSKYEINGKVGFRVRVVASDACNVSPAVFRHYQKPANLVTGVAARVFSGVCSWPQMEDLPIGVPALGSSPQSFRLSYFDIVVDSVTIANNVWTVVQTEVAVLLTSMNYGETLDAGESVWVLGS